MQLIGKDGKNAWERRVHLTPTAHNFSTDAMMLWTSFHGSRELGNSSVHKENLRGFKVDLNLSPISYASRSVLIRKKDLTLNIENTKCNSVLKRTCTIHLRQAHLNSFSYFFIFIFVRNWAQLLKHATNYSWIISIKKRNTNKERKLFNSL